MFVRLFMIFVSRTRANKKNAAWFLKMRRNFFIKLLRKHMQIEYVV